MESAVKFIVWLLVIINLGLLAYFNQSRFLPSIPQLKTTEIQPEKIAVLNQTQVEALPKKSKALPPPLILEPAVTTCFEWGIFTGESLSRAQAAIAKLSLQAEMKEETSLEAKRFWVYRLPLKTPEEAQKKTTELKAIGVEDLFVVQEPKWKNAISFGVFEDEQLATNLLNELKAKGVKNVVKSLRNQGKNHASFQFNDLTEDQMLALKKLKPNFPEASLSEVSCRG